MSHQSCDFSAIVVNYNGAAILSDCVDALLTAGLPPQQIIVIDNGSHDDSMTTLIAQHPRVVTHTNGCNAGFARAVNQGLARVHTPFAVLVNNDARLANNALAVLARGFDEHPRAAFLGAQLFGPQGHPQDSAGMRASLATECLPKPILRRVMASRIPSRTVQNPVQVESISGAVFAIRMAALDDFGAMDEDFFFYYEETEWCHRAAQHGWQVWLLPQARAIHLQGATAGQFNALARIELHRSRLIYFRKTHPNWQWLVLAVVLFRTTLNAVFGALSVLLTLGLQPRQRRKTMSYWHILAWYLKACPPDVGLPGKCPRDAAPARSSS